MKNIYIKSFILYLFSLFTICAYGDNFTGVIIDKDGQPVAGASIRSMEIPTRVAYSDKSGTFVINVSSDDKLTVESADYSKTIVLATKSSNIVLDRTTTAVQLGNGIIQTRKESTAAVGLITSEELMKSSSLDVNNALYGRGLGLITTQDPGIPWGSTTSMNIRGVNTLSSNSPMVIVDGIERSLSILVKEEIETITILKDAPSLALYGLRGANGVILVTTKEGINRTSQIGVSFDYGFIKAKELIKMVDGPTYAKALNEAMTLDGLPNVRYNEHEISAFETGLYPNYYPNVNWLDQVFDDHASQNIFNITVRGGGDRVRYFTVANLQSYEGLIKPQNISPQYSSQLKSSKLNIRTNLDINITKTTSLKVKMLGVLHEYNRPGTSETDFTPLAYNVPASAMPIKTLTDEWGGSDTWKRNPVAEIVARGYGKSNSRNLFTDWTISQNLNSFVEGMSFDLKAGFDSYAQYWEQVSPNYRYERNEMKFDNNGDPIEASYKATIFGDNTLPSFSSRLSNQWRRLTLSTSINYSRSFLQDHQVNGKLMFDLDQAMNNGQHNTYNRQRFGLYGHYGYKGKYFADLAFSAGASNRMQDGHKYGFFPAIGASWLISEENFLKDKAPFMNFLKLRASWGLSGSDYVPEVNLWEQSFGGGGSYFFGSNQDTPFPGLSENRMVTSRIYPETSSKTNVGLEFRLFNIFDLTTELFYQKRYNILLATDGRVSSVIGAANATESEGEATNKGIEIGLVAENSYKELKYSIGGNLAYYKNKIVTQNEVFRAHDYLKRTGRPIGQIFGYEAIGFFKDQADIDNNPEQMFSTVMPGDIKFKDQNNDGIINSLDQVALGYNTSSPEIYYSVFLNLEYKGFGIDAMFQGVSHITVPLTTNSIFWGMRNSYLNISQHLYDNRWTPDNQNSLYPRLTTLENNNNYNTNSVWLGDGSYLKLRTCEVYYKIPRSLCQKVKLNTSKVFVRGTDLFTIKKLDMIDPETSVKGGNGAFPATYSINVGMQLSF